MQVALRLWAQLVRSGPPRRLPLTHHRQHSAVLVGDAALSTRRAAALLVIPAEGSLREFRAGFSVILEVETLKLLGPRPEHAINRAEVWWIVKALETWGGLLHGRSLLCFGDNQAAIAGCVSGYSSSPYVARMVGAVHDILCRHQITCWFEYVHSDSNNVDDASREVGEASIRGLGASVVTVSPVLESDLQQYHPLQDREACFQ